LLTKLIMMRLPNRLLLVTATLLAPLAARASEIDASTQANADRGSTALPLFGVMADAGLPDGANASLVLRPLRWLRLHGGGGYNTISTGVRAGITLVPFGMGPSATLEAGHYFEGNANGMAQRFAGSTFSSATLDRLGYDYGNAHLGLDLGYRRVTFFIHGGMSYMRAQIHNADSVLASQVSGAGGNGSTEISFKQDPTVRAWFPSAKIGLLIYLW
jgi:hypothetical protein